MAWHTGKKGGCGILEKSQRKITAELTISGQLTREERGRELKA